MVAVVVHRRSAAAPDALWQLVADPTRMSVWSPEVVASRWLGGAVAAAPGARFRGSNRRGHRGWRRWSTTSTITGLEPGRSIAWDVAIGPLAVASWSYEIAVDAGGAVITERFEDRRGRVMHVIGPLVRGVGDADLERHNRQQMEATLSALCATAEAAAGG